MFYTYAHYKPNGDIFYIGKGQAKRAWSANSRNRHWNRVVNKHGAFQTEILATWETDQEAKQHEILLISCFRDLGHKLANVSDGGESNSGYKFSQKTCKWRSKNTPLRSLDKTKTNNCNYQGPILATEKETGNSITLFGTTDIAKFNFLPAHVYACIRGERKTHKGHTFTRIIKE